jgi:hypothetical protein
VIFPEANITSDLLVLEESDFPFILILESKMKLENAKREQSLLPLLS